MYGAGRFAAFHERTPIVVDLGIHGSVEEAKQSIEVLFMLLEHRIQIDALATSPN